MWIHGDLRSIKPWNSQVASFKSRIKTIALLKIYNRGSSMNSYYWKDSQTHAQTINRAPSNPSKTKRHIYQFLWKRNQPPSATFSPPTLRVRFRQRGLEHSRWPCHQRSCSDRPLKAFGLGSKRRRFVATATCRLRRCDAAMSGVALVHIGLVSLEMLVRSVSKDIGLEYCFGMLW